ncbi:cutinase family protein [Aeromicrobium duanguangcaii]|uniref:cutinase family protein n=1 Tax=Aeromicrobium duanguangcaii TaxID=2968086 RepID=UPI002017C857|nr:cutinase family protein [Aeromicrobium duanguangcaii]MCL3837931.1 cutinase family protein [Aeromicrobium duanguangcaii]
MKNVRRLCSQLAGGLLALSAVALPAAAAAPASAADDCAEVHVIVVRGTGEPGTYGWIVGDGLVRKIRAQVPGAKATALDYPASIGRDSVPAGITELVSTVRARAAACPDEELVLSGYSQGAQVVNGALGVDLAGTPNGPVPVPAVVPAELSSHIAAIALFGDPLRIVGRSVPEPYASRTVSFCQPKDLVCDPAPDSRFLPHLAYLVNGDLGRAARFVADRV